MFIGEYKSSLDAKGRVIIPAKLREELGENFILTKGLDSCLTIYPISAWNAFVEKLKNLPFASGEARKFVRYFASSAVDCELDSQGRITIPIQLREYADLEKELIVNGNLTQIEIWSREKYLDSDSSNLTVEEIAEKMAEMGI